MSRRSRRSRLLRHAFTLCSAISPALCAAVCVLSLANAAASEPAAEPAAATSRSSAPGPSGPLGPSGSPRRVRTLTIDKPGVYENYLVDAEWGDVDAVRIRADGVTLRNCEVRNARRDGIEVYGADVLIENCRIHHLLAGTFDDQRDAHGITGRPTRLTVRNCEIGYVSGDCLQFDPGRGPWTDVVIEHCRLYAGPLPADAGAFKKGQDPGENALDTKQRVANARSRIVIRDSVIYGFAKGGQIGNRAALNLKNHVDATVENCRFYDNEICLRLRGPGDGGEFGGEFGGAHVAVADCAFYDTRAAIRTEDAIERLSILRPAFGTGVGRKVQHVGGAPPGFRLVDERPAPPLER